MASSQSNPQSQLAWIEGYVFISLLLMICQLIFGCLPSRFRCDAVKLFSWLTYEGVTFLIPYILGLVRNASFRNQLFLLWAVLLVHVYGNIDNMSMLNLDDRTHTKALMFKTIIQLFLLAQAINRFKNKELGHALIVSLMLVYYKCLARALSLVRVGSNQMKLIVMGRDPRSGDEMGMDPRSIPKGGWKYFVARVIKIDARVTMDQIWQYDDGGMNLLTGQLKDACLSFTFFWLLLRRFVGGSAYESSDQPEAWNFIQDRLLQQGEYEKPFRVIEAELDFLYDYCYRVYPFTYFFGFSYFLFRHIATVGGVAWLVIFLSTKYKRHYDNVQITWHNHDVDILLTWAFIIAITVSELIQFGVFIASNWMKVRLVCSYILRDSWKRETIVDFCIEKALRVLCLISNISCLPRERELCQYSLLDHSDEVFLPVFSRLLISPIATLLGNPILEVRVKSKSIKLSNPIKKAVIASLQKHGRQLTNGVATLALEASRLGAPVINLAWACKELETDAHVILVWHIATALCEMDDDHEGNLPNTVWKDDFNVATSLSKYCAYLVAFAPELLPGYALSTEYTCNMVVKDVRIQLYSCKSAQERIDKIMGLVDDSPESGEGQRGTILRQGAMLRKNLLTIIPNPEQRWEVLASFWGEMILYLAPNSSNHLAHAEKLGSGGEFITHLWALLFHAGITDRESFHSNDATNVC